VTPFRDVRDYVAIPRLKALRLSPDGGWLAAVVQASGRDGKKFVSSIWRIDPGGSAPARLTRSAEGETSPEFLPDGSLLFISARPDPAGPGQDASRAAGDTAAIAGPGIPADGDEASAVWLLPAAGGEPYQVVSAPGGVTAVATARAASSVILAVPTLPGSAGAEQDASRREARKRAGVTAILHESGPVRYWDHDLGPDQLSLMGAEIAAAARTGADAGDPRGGPGPGGRRCVRTRRAA
jgi:dipeptidyl aminopeptidase/acylaminoacyl peptidase